MAKELGVKFDPVEVTWGTSIAALQANKIDVMFVLDATPKRVCNRLSGSTVIVLRSCRLS